MKLTLDHQRPETADIRSFLFRPERPVNHQPGQFLEWQLPHDPADDRGTTRWFTIASSPTEPFVQVTTRLAPKSSSFKEHLQQLRPGDSLEASGPDGEFTLPNDPRQPVVLVAGGIGITPYRSIIKWLVDTSQTRPLQLIYAARNPQDFVFTDLFEQLPGLKTTYVAAETAEGWDGETGQLSGRRILDLAGGAEGKLIYLSGPEPMVVQFKEELIQLGVPEDRLMLDDFPGYPGL